MIRDFMGVTEHTRTVLDSYTDDNNGSRKAIIYRAPYRKTSALSPTEAARRPLSKRKKRKASVINQISALRDTLTPTPLVKPARY